MRTQLPPDREFADWMQDRPAAPASAVMVNRTHRIVRERARLLQAQKSKTRSLWIPLTVSAGLLTLFCFAVWSVLSQNDAMPTGMPDASQQMLVFMMWCVPVSAAVLAVVWFQRGYGRVEDNGSRG